MRRIAATAVALFAVAAATACSDVAGPLTGGPASTAPSFSMAGAKVTVCHAAGRAGTTKYVSITVSANGANAHFTNNGTPKAGHELDYLATAAHPCNGPEAGQLVVCVLQGGAVYDPRSFALTSTVPDSYSLMLHTCSAAADVAPGSYTVYEPAPEAAGPSSWFVSAIDASPSGALAASMPGAGGWDAATGRGMNAWATVTVTANATTTVDFWQQN